jgi:hypothetical protein
MNVWFKTRAQTVEDSWFLERTMIALTNKASLRNVQTKHHLLHIDGIQCSLEPWESPYQVDRGIILEIVKKLLRNNYTKYCI